MSECCSRYIQVFVTWFVSMHRCALILFVCLYAALPTLAQKTITGPGAEGNRVTGHRSFAGIDDEPVELLDIDTLFYIDNRGLTRILADLNGNKFKLVTDPDEVRQSANAFLIPRHREITINISNYMLRGRDNLIQLSSSGPEGSTAEIVIGDLLVPGQQVAYAIIGLQDLPERPGLLHGYPNPFIDQTTITFEIPENRTNGIQVNLSVFDVTGRRVRTLVNERRFPGSFTVVWDGLTDAATDAVPGVYFCHLLTEELQRTVQVIRLR